MRAEADRARLMQLFQNLIGNAVKFCKAGDSITVASRTRGSSAQIEISDTGPGIAPDDLPHIFDPYYSASKKAPEDRHGPGPLHRQGNCRCSRRQIRCASEPGIGTTFSIALPLAH
jgi:two-component system sensor histidine kinase BaeS